jgi:hypothetical protein
MRLSHNKNVIARWLEIPMKDRGQWDHEYKGTDNSPTTRGVYHVYGFPTTATSDPRAIFVGDSYDVTRGMTFDGVYSSLVFDQEIAVWRYNGSYDTIQLTEFKPRDARGAKKFVRIFKNTQL